METLKHVNDSKSKAMRNAVETVKLESAEEMDIENTSDDQSTIDVDG